MNWTASDAIAFLRRTGQKVPEWLEKAKEPKESKYRNKPKWVDGHRFPSIHEANRYSELKLLAKDGEISELKLQVPFALAGGVKYFADFTYTENGQTIIEDAKGVRTKEYRIKKRLMADAGYEIREV